MDQSPTNTITILLLLMISLIFVFLEIFELNKIWIIWESAQTILDVNFFNNCIKYQIIAKGTFAVFSSYISFSAVFLTFFIYISLDFFIDKVLYTFIYYNYFFFGPYMLSICILGLFNWDTFLYVCHDPIHFNKQISFNNFLEKSKNLNSFHNKIKDSNSSSNGNNSSFNLRFYNISKDKYLTSFIELEKSNKKVSSNKILTINSNIFKSNNYHCKNSFFENGPLMDINSFHDDYHYNSKQFYFQKELLIIILKINLIILRF